MAILSFSLLFSPAFETAETALYAAELRVCAACPFTDPEKAISAAVPGDTVILDGGTYSVSTLIINKTLKLQGRNGAVLDGQQRGNVIRIYKADDVEIENIIIKNGGVSDIDEYAGIYVEYSKRCSIHNNEILRTAYGIYIANSSDCVVRGNHIRGEIENEVHAGNGIHIWSSTGTQLLENRIEKHRDGLYFEFATGMLIQKNECMNNIRYGMHFMFAGDNVFKENLFHDNSTGVAVMYSRNITVLNNEFRDSRGFSAYGLLLKDIVSSRFEDNLFSANTVALFLDNCGRNEFRRNLVKSNGWAVRILGSSDGNNFEDNAFVDNVFDISTNSRDNPNSYRSNFWSKYTGYDLNRDGFGDVPYYPVQIFGYWVGKYELLIFLLSSPLVEFLEFAERAFPVITPTSLTDPRPVFKKREQ